MRSTRAILLGLLLVIPLAVVLPSVAQAVEELDCVVSPRRVIRLAAPVQGLVTEVTVDRGDRVSVGQVIARFEASVEERTVELTRLRARSDAAIRSTMARYEFLRRKLSRLEQLRARDIATAAALDEAVAEARVAEMNIRVEEMNRDLAIQELRRAEAQLALRTVLSPVAGEVVERALSPGEYSNETAHIVSIAELDPLHVEVVVPATLYGRIGRGSMATVRMALPNAPELRASVALTDTVADAASATFGIRLLVPNPRSDLPVGIRCKVSFALDDGPDAGSASTAQRGARGIGEQGRVSAVVEAIDRQLASAQGEPAAALRRVRLALTASDTPGTLSASEAERQQMAAALRVVQAETWPPARVYLTPVRTRLERYLSGQ